MIKAPPVADRLERLPHRVLVPAGLLVSAVLAISSLHGDSVTFDEPFVMTAGASALRTGDYRLVDAHPPLVGLWASLPLSLSNPRMWPDDAPGWRIGNLLYVARAWFFELNHGQDLVVPGRYMIVLLLLGTCLCTYALARQLFGRSAGLLALAIAALSPNLLAHGRLVTTDLPLTFFSTLTLLLFARLAARITWPRLAGAALSCAAMSLVKLSWVVILPALLAIAVHALLRSAPLPVALRRIWPRSADDAQGDARSVTCLISPGRRAGALLGCWLVIALTVWAAIWSGYGWRYHALPAAARQELNAAASGGRPHNRTRFSEAGWRKALNDDKGEPRAGLQFTFIRWARANRLLPEAYLHAIAFLSQSAQSRRSYLCGEHSGTGWRSYFLVAFLLKTPLATTALLLLGLAALIWRRPVRSGAGGLLLGMGVFAAVYLGFAVLARVNIGLRYILPLYPLLIAMASAAVTWIDAGSDGGEASASLPARARSWTVGALLAWLVVATLWAHPHYLSYFNALAGGPTNGHRFLADSNLDWGQDLLRLQRYAQEHPKETINLSYFGSADPSRYGCRCRSLPSSFNFGQPAPLTAGTYVISATHLLGIYKEMARAAFWRVPQNVKVFRRLQAATSGPLPAPPSPYQLRLRQRAQQQLDVARRLLLISRLQRRQEDGRIGHSLFVFRLSQREVDRLSSL